MPPQQLPLCAGLPPAWRYSGPKRHPSLSCGSSLPRTAACFSLEHLLCHHCSALSPESCPISAQNASPGIRSLSSWKRGAPHCPKVRGQLPRAVQAARLGITLKSALCPKEAAPHCPHCHHTSACPSSCPRYPGCSLRHHCEIHAAWAAKIGQASL